MTPIVLQLQQEALDLSVTPTNLLRKSLIVCHKLKLNEIRHWIDSELNGYDVADDIPEYRDVKGSVRLWNPIHGWIPVKFENSNQGELCSHRKIHQTISELEKLASQNETKFFQVPFSLEEERKFSESLRLDFKTQVTLFMPQGEVIRIVEQVRNIILDWSLMLEEKGILGHDLAFTFEETRKASAIPQTVNNFYGTVKSPQIQQSNSTAIQFRSEYPVDTKEIQAFLEHLESKISDLQLSPEYMAELRAEISTVSSQLSSPKPKATIFIECFKSIRSVLEKASGTAIGSLLIDRLSKLSL